VLILGVTIDVRAQTHVFNAAVLAFPFPEGRHEAHCHCHWRHWFHCHCSSCLFLMSRLQWLVSYPVPILWIVCYNTGGMRYEVSSTRQCHILVALYGTICYQSQHCDVIADVHRQCWCHCYRWALLKGSLRVICDCINSALGLITCQTTNLGWSWSSSKGCVM